MRDLFAILAIILAVVGLGVFRVPDENALVAAGLQVAAERATYQARHPLQISVKGRELSVSGRVESESEGQRWIATLAGLEGVETVVNDLTVLPTVAPFVLRGWQNDTRRYEGHVPQVGLAEDLAEDLPVAVGAPDQNWDEVARLADQALDLMLGGEFTLLDQSLTLTGQVHRPHQVAQVKAFFDELPEGYTAQIAVTAVDDGLPYSVQIARDALMGLRISGKLPPDFDTSGFENLGPVQVLDLSHAPRPLEQYGFGKALAEVLPLVAALDLGVVTVAPGVVSISGGPVSAEVMAQAEALRGKLPEGYALTLALTPEDLGGPLALSANWDGLALELRGRVPAGFEGSDLSEVQLGVVALEKGPYPDLQGWVPPARDALAALVLLDRGTVVYEEGGVTLSGVAANPTVRRRARALAGAMAATKILLADDGVPPAFTLRYNATSGASVEGKLPQGLPAHLMAEALGLPQVRGRLTMSPSGDGTNVLKRLSALRANLDRIEGFELQYSEEGVVLTVQPVYGPDASILKENLAEIAEVTNPKRPLPGTRRHHAVLKQAQVFSDGFWFPDLGFAPSIATCASQADLALQIPFADGQFTPGDAAFWPLAHLAALTRSCTQFAGLTLSLETHAGGADLPVLNRQLARRRAEAVKQALITRGVSPEQIRILPAQATEGPDQIKLTWQ
ncbi:MAG: BON domain-containing protein [Pelagimonas sp.]